MPLRTLVPCPQLTGCDAPVYDAFISYSHARDKPIATTLQVRRAEARQALVFAAAFCACFATSTGLTATPHLWPSIERALERSRFLILLASTGAANLTLGRQRK